MIRKNQDSAARWEYGRVIAKRRMQLELTQGDLGASVGLSIATISNIENGKHPLDVSTLSRIADALCVSVHRLVWEANDERESNPVLRSMAPLFEEAISVIEKHSRKDGQGAPGMGRKRGH